MPHLSQASPAATQKGYQLKSLSKKYHWCLWYTGGCTEQQADSALPSSKCKEERLFPKHRERFWPKSLLNEWMLKKRMWFCWSWKNNCWMRWCWSVKKSWQVERRDGERTVVWWSNTSVSSSTLKFACSTEFVSYSVRFTELFSAIYTLVSSYTTAQSAWGCSWMYFVLFLKCCTVLSTTSPQIPLTIVWACIPASSSLTFIPMYMKAQLLPLNVYK